ALVFGLVGRALRMPLLMAAIIAGPLILALFSPRYMDATFDYGLVRCVFGFSLGVVLFRLCGSGVIRARNEMEGRAASGGGYLRWSAAEIATVALIAAFMILFGTGWAGVASPFFFALAIYVFAHERGVLSALLLKRPLVFLGTVSY